MKFKYETPQLIMRVCSRADARMIYHFYQRNLKDFSLYEPIDQKAASTLVYFEKILDVEQELLLQKECFRYYLFEKDNPFRVVGTISFREISYADHLSCAKLGYKIDKEYRRRGYAREAIYTGCSALFAEELLHRIEATVLPDNEPSWRLLESIGFEREGLLRKKFRFNGAWRDHYLYAAINPYE